MTVAAGQEQQVARPEIDIVIVRYHSRLAQLVTDIEATVDVPYTLTVVDNSADNTGWTAAVDAATYQQAAPLACFVNPDVRLGAGWLAPVLAAFTDPMVVLAGPRSIVPSAAEWWGIGEDTLPGWLMVVRRAWYSTHRLDRRFFLMFSDTDLNRQAQRDGKRIAYLDGLPVRHETLGYETGGDKASWMALDGATYRAKWGIPEPAPLTVGACMIVRDEERTLPRCLDSLHGAVDYIHVTDTGSTDGTLEVLRRHQASVYVGHSAWCDDFAAARNASIEHRVGDWLIWLDADDVLVEDYHGALKEWAPQLPSWAAGLIEVRMMRDDGTVGWTSWQKRVFRNGRGVHFEGRIHEQLVGPTKAYKLSDLHIEHWGYADSDGRRKVKSERNRRLLGFALDEEPLNPFYLHQLGMQMLVDGEYTAAFDRLTCAVDVVLADLGRHGQAGYGALLFTHAVVAACQMERWAQAVAIGGKCPPQWLSADLAYNLGVAWHNLGARCEARRWLWRAARGSFVATEGDPANRTWRPWLALAQMAQAEGRKERARRYMQRAIETGANEQEVRRMAKVLEA